MSDPLRDSLPLAGSRGVDGMQAFADAIDNKIEGDPSSDAVAPRWRTRLYVAGLIVAALIGFVSIVSPIWFEADIAEKIRETALAVGTVYAAVASGLGVAYRPTR